jgi:hypothetical protein
VFKHTCIATALAVGALVAPTAAQADLGQGVSAVKAHTTRADEALDRAVALYGKHAGARADRSFAQSRREMGAAARDAAKLRSQADTAVEKARPGCARPMTPSPPSTARWPTSCRASPTGCRSGSAPS